MKSVSFKENTQKLSTDKWKKIPKMIVRCAFKYLNNKAKQRLVCHTIILRTG